MTRTRQSIRLQLGRWPGIRRFGKTVLGKPAVYPSENRCPGRLTNRGRVLRIGHIVLKLVFGPRKHTTLNRVAVSSVGDCRQTVGDARLAFVPVSAASRWENGDVESLLAHYGRASGFVC